MLPQVYPPYAYLLSMFHYNHYFYDNVGHAAHIIYEDAYHGFHLKVLKLAILFGSQQCLLKRCCYSGTLVYAVSVMCIGRKSKQR